MMVSTGSTNSQMLMAKDASFYPITWLWKTEKELLTYIRVCAEIILSHGSEVSGSELNSLSPIDTWERWQLDGDSFHALVLPVFSKDYLCHIHQASMHQPLVPTSESIHQMSKETYGKSRIKRRNTSISIPVSIWTIPTSLLVTNFIAIMDHNQ